MNKASAICLGILLLSGLCCSLVTGRSEEKFAWEDTSEAAAREFIPVATSQQKRKYLLSELNVMNPSTHCTVSNPLRNNAMFLLHLQSEISKIISQILSVYQSILLHFLQGIKTM